MKLQINADIKDKNMNNKHQKDRNQRMYKMRKKGMTFVDIGWEFPKKNGRPITPQRVEQIIKRIEEIKVAELTRKDK